MVTTRMLFIGIAVAIAILLVGCAASRTRLSPSLTWQQVTSRGAVDVSEPYFERDSLIVPISFAPTITGDSLSVVFFTGRISGSTIVISADLRVPSSEAHPYLVALPASQVREDQYKIVFKGGDGTERELATKRIPARLQD